MTETQWHSQQRERCSYLEEQQVVAERAHGDADLCEVVQVLQLRILLQHESMVDSSCEKERGGQVFDVARFARMRTERETVVTQVGTQLVQRAQVGVQVVREQSIRLEDGNKRTNSGKQTSQRPSAQGTNRCASTFVKKSDRVVFQIPFLGSRQGVVVGTLTDRLVVDH